ncbi:MAG: phytanoyl-CoA dioxygenase family protein [Aquihabitans sp.]
MLIDREPTFRDPATQARFAADGYVVVPALDEAELERALEVWRATHDDHGEGFSADVVGRTTEATARITEEIGPIWDRILEEQLVEYQPFLISYLTKWPGEDSAHHLHQDWTYVDERRYRTMSFWIALDDASTSLDNGPVQVIPGSHRLVDAYRGPAVTDWYVELGPQLSRHLVSVDVRAGEAIVLDNAVLHGSPPNRSAHPRRAMAAAVAPKAAAFVFAQPAGDHDEIALYGLGEDYLTGFDPDAPGIGQRGVAATVPRLLGVDHQGLRALVGDLPADLAGAPDARREHTTACATALAGALERIAADHAAVEASGGTDAPARYLPGWAPSIRPDQRLVPLAADGRWTAVARERYRSVTRALDGQADLTGVWIATVAPGDELEIGATPEPGDLTLLVIDAPGPDGSLRIGDAADRLGTPQPQGAVVSGSHLVARNLSQLPAAVLGVESGPPAPARPRFARWVARRSPSRLSLADEIMAAVAPRTVRPNEGVSR